MSGLTGLAKEIAGRAVERAPPRATPARDQEGATAPAMTAAASARSVMAKLLLASPVIGQGIRIWPFCPSSRAKPPGGRRSRGTFLADLATRKVPPLRLAALGSGRDDGLLSYANALPVIGGGGLKGRRGKASDEVDEVPMSQAHGTRGRPSPSAPYHEAPPPITGEEYARAAPKPGRRSGSGRRS
jgi:hypothetical protein